MSAWRNWYTRTFEGRVERSLRVQVPPSTKKGQAKACPFFVDKRTQNPTERSSVNIGFQDSLDAFLLAMMPNCRGFEADL